MTVSHILYFFFAIFQEKKNDIYKSKNESLKNAGPNLHGKTVEREEDEETAGRRRVAADGDAGQGRRKGERWEFWSFSKIDFQRKLEEERERLRKEEMRKAAAESLEPGQALNEIDRMINM